MFLNSFFQASGKTVGLIFGFVSVLGCVSGKKTKTVKVPEIRNETAPKSASALDQPAVCPEGSVFYRNPRRCVSGGGLVLGPFPLELQEQCRTAFPAQAATCVQKQDWPAEFLIRLASAYKDGCPAGTTPMAGGTCESSGSVYGPFTLQQVVDCRSKLSQSDSSPCDKLVWSVELFNRVDQEPEKKRIYIVDDVAMQGGQVKDTDDSVNRRTGQEAEGQGAGADPVGADKRDAAAFNKNRKSKKDSESPKSDSKKNNPELIVIPPADSGSQGLSETQVQVTTAREQEQSYIKAPTYCIYSWQEQPGTADFSTQNQKLASLRRPIGYPVDRQERDALTGSREFHNMDVCNRARFLKKCFQKVILDSDSPAAQTFRGWAMGRVRPVEAHMAFVMKESRLGLWPDTCWNGKCTGVGFARVREARTAAGRLFAENDTIWRGIVHNILTNLEFSLRAIAEKTKEGPIDLHSLAYMYAGKSKMRDRYALDVDKYYRDLVGCQIDDR